MSERGPEDPTRDDPVRSAKDGASDGGSDAPARPHPPEPQALLLDAQHVERARALVDLVEDQLPAGYRLAAFQEILRQQAQPTLEPARHAGPAGRSPGSRAELEDSRLRLQRYAEVLSQPGRMLLKAMVALEAAQQQLQVDWMTPSEIERLLRERAGLRSVYRTNLSNALRNARELVDRRRRGRGFEYRLTARGRERLHRELLLLGD